MARPNTHAESTAPDRQEGGSTGKAEGRPVLLLTTREDTAETEALVRAVGARLQNVVRQIRRRPDPLTHVGMGKLEEVRSFLSQGAPPMASHGPFLVVVDAALRPPALFTLEDRLQVEVWDRVRLILEIFRRNARIKEARLQVELARLRYELPFVHEALHRQLTGEHPGFMGGGEVEARTYETHLKRRTKRILQELERVKKERRTRRTGRRRLGLRLIAITGYTNSGKSSLLNALTDSQVDASPQMFSTLQTATRRLRSEYHPKRSSDVLLTDTVGFIGGLPPWLIDAFASTLEEISEADAILLLIDASEPFPIVEEKAATALSILDRIHAPRRLIVTLNKADLLPLEHRQELQNRLRLSTLPPDVPVLFTSAQTREGLLELVQVLLDQVLENQWIQVVLDRSRPAHVRLEAWIRTHTDVLESEDQETHRRLRIRCPLTSWGLLLREAQRAEARLQKISPSGNEGGRVAF